MVTFRMTKVPNVYDQGDMTERAAKAIASILRQAIATRGQASLMVSGGSSPKPLYDLLSHEELDWSKVTISLVDERWVEPGQTGSNEDFIRGALIKNNGSQANFFGLKTEHVSVEAGLKSAEAKFGNMKMPFDICIMGMGSDAHTASWFPNCGGLLEALALENTRTLCAIDATSAPVAGDFPNRISLTLRAVLDSHAIFLFIPGADKRRAFDDALNKSIDDAPVNALRQAGPKLHIFASPTL